MIFGKKSPKMQPYILVVKISAQPLILERSSQNNVSLFGKFQKSAQSNKKQWVKIRPIWSP
jgi:hypothetical protein